MNIMCFLYTKRSQMVERFVTRGSVAFCDYKINLSLNLFKEFLPSNEQYKLLIFSCS